MSELRRVSAAHAVGRLKLVAKLTPPGKLLGASRRLLRARARARSAPPAAAVAAAPPARASSPALYIVPAAAGSWGELEDTLQSILDYEGDNAQILVVDDCTPDCHEAAVRSRFETAAVVPTERPSGGPPRLPGLLGVAHAHAVEDLDVE